jgi:hypothetical protein
MASNGGSKVIQKWIRQARAQGWTVDMSGSGHYLFRSPDGKQQTTVPSTPGRGRSMMNSRAQLRRIGLMVEI